MYAAAYIWAKVIGYLEQQLTPLTVSAWLDDAEVVELTEEKLVIYTPSDFRQEIIRSRCKGYIEQALGELFHLEAKLEVWGDSELRAFREKKKSASTLLYNPQFSFESFVPGSCNQMAVRIAQAAAREPGQEIYNPLFLYGPPGVGKTHLLYAIANHILAEGRLTNVVYIRGDQFTNELISAIREGTTGEFKAKYRHADVLLVDDIQFIAGKEATQEEFFHTFNALYQQKKQIVMTADRRPGDMVTLEERLRSRFGEGILVAIQPPDYDTRLSIARAKAKKLNLELDEQVLCYIAGNLTDNVRQIEGALKKLRAFRDLSAMELTMENVARTLEDLVAGESETPMTAAAVIRNVCRYYGLDEDTLKGPQKSKGVAEPRQVAMYLLRKLVKLSYPEIAKAFHRDHATVQHGVKKIDAALKLREGRLEGILRDITAAITESM